MLLAAGVFFAQAQNYMDKTIDFLQKCDIMDSQGKHTELKLIQYFICIINNLNFLKKIQVFNFFTKLYTQFKEWCKPSFCVRRP